MKLGRVTSFAAAVWILPWDFVPWDLVENGQHVLMSNYCAMLQFRTFILSVCWSSQETSVVQVREALWILSCHPLSPVQIIRKKPHTFAELDSFKDMASMY